MTRPRSSTLATAALAVLAVLLAATAALLNYSADPHGNKIVVTVRLWAAPIAAAYEESFKAFNRAHPDIEVHINMVAYSNYFQTLRTDVAGDSADDIFWMSNAYLAAYADNGRLMNISKAVEPTRNSGLGAGSGRPVHPRRRAVGCTAADRRRYRGVLQRGSARCRRYRSQPAEQPAVEPQ